MKTFKKTFKISIVTALILLMAVAIPFYDPLPVAAHDPPMEITNYAYITAAPNPVGVGQRVIIVMWLNRLLPGALVENDVRFHNFQLTITRPDGETETVTWPVVTDTTSSQYYIYTPEQAGTYQLVFHHPGEEYIWNQTSTMQTWYGDKYLPATSKTLNLTVQEEPLPDPVTNPLPTEYWTRPIYGDNIQWATISSNWLWKDRNFFQPDGVAPNSPHIMWTWPINDGGVVGGEGYATTGMNFYQGMAYNARFPNPLIMNGRLYTQLPFGNSPSGDGYISKDLRTGETIWYRLDMPTPSFGYYYDYEHYNQHGVIPDGYLFTNNFARAFDPRTGRDMFNVTNVPSGFDITHRDGYHLRYVANYTAGWLAQWNSSKVFQVQNSGTINGGTQASYDWNITLPSNIPANSRILWAKTDDLLLGTNLVDGGTSNWPTTPNPFTMWAISLKEDNIGRLLWIQNYTVSGDDVTRMFNRVCSDNRVIIFQDRETMLFHGYSLDDGRQLWSTTRTAEMNDFDFYDMSVTDQRASVAYGTLYAVGNGGILYAYNTSNGKLLWSYGNGGPGNSTFMGMNGAYPNYPAYIYSIADGKVYILTGEHSPNSPLYTGGLTRCINATSGKEIWTLSGWGGYPSRTGAAMADGFFVYYNCYDNQVYCIGKGSSATTVTIQNNIITYGSNILIGGTVTDIAAGTQQKEQAARFPNGVPAVSDASMKDWMEYVYMQQSRPTNTTGVLVKLYVLDANNNYRPIGETTSDDNGFYSFEWKPDITGKYTVYARFDGSESYWPSQAVSAFAVSEPDPTQEPPAQADSIADQYFVPAVIGIIVAIIIGFALLALLLLKKRP
jgi:hypothetical protein